VQLSVFAADEKGIHASDQDPHHEQNTGPILKGQGCFGKPFSSKETSHFLNCLPVTSVFLEDL
jgi:hypothetical protein